MPRTPLSLLLLFISKTISMFFRNNFILIALLVVLLTAATVIVSRSVAAIAPDIIKAIHATTALVEQVNEVQSGFTVVLEKIAGLEATIARVERIINRIPDRLLRDEETGEWEPWHIETTHEVIEERGEIVSPRIEPRTRRVLGGR